MPWSKGEVGVATNLEAEVGYKKLLYLDDILGRPLLGLRLTMIRMVIRERMRDYPNSYNF